MNNAQATGDWLRHAQALPDLCALRVAALCLRYSLVTLLSAPLWSGHLQAQPLTLTVADYRTYLPDTHPVPQALQALAQTVNHQPVLPLPLEVIRNPLQGTPRQQIQALQNGTAQAPNLMLAAASGLAELVPSFSGFDAPYAIQGAEQAEQFYASEAAEQMLRQLHDAGLHGLAWMENGWRVITANRPLDSLQDFHDLRIRTIPIALSQQLFQALGATPVSLPANQVQAALSAGKLPAQESFITQLLQQPLQQYHPHLWLTQHSYGAQVLVMNLKQWQQLSHAQQLHLQTSARTAAAMQRQRMRQFDQLALATLAAQGIQIHQPSGELLQTLKDATRHLRAPHQAAP